ncbi:hypothetical protein ElyMa_000929700 [Elysia marginata]|uniref:Uncharacterized protein n=1 Tax=Elysia marginata TaxID=1093978 RepID=A0AAV4HBF1_9GAST|nr:hypothetical protein ElyMa_000929700 [Elysia marginata]
MAGDANLSLDSHLDYLLKDLNDDANSGDVAQCLQIGVYQDRTDDDHDEGSIILCSQESKEYPLTQSHGVNNLLDQTESNSFNPLTHSSPLSKHEDHSEKATLLEGLFESEILRSDSHVSKMDNKNNETLKKRLIEDGSVECFKFKRKKSKSFSQPNILSSDIKDGEFFFDNSWPGCRKWNSLMSDCPKYSLKQFSEVKNGPQFADFPAHVTPDQAKSQHPSNRPTIVTVCDVTEFCINQTDIPADQISPELTTSNQQSRTLSFHEVRNDSAEIIQVSDAQLQPCKKHFEALDDKNKILDSGISQKCFESSKMCNRTQEILQDVQKSTDLPKTIKSPQNSPSCQWYLEPDRQIIQKGSSNIVGQEKKNSLEIAPKQEEQQVLQKLSLPTYSNEQLQAESLQGPDPKSPRGPETGISKQYQPRVHQDFQDMFESVNIHNEQPNSETGEEQKKSQNQQKPAVLSITQPRSYQLNYPVSQGYLETAKSQMENQSLISIEEEQNGLQEIQKQKGSQIAQKMPETTNVIISQESQSFPFQEQKIKSHELEETETIKNNKQQSDVPLQNFEKKIDLIKEQNGESNSSIDQEYFQSSDICVQERLICLNAGGQKSFQNPEQSGNLPILKSQLNTPTCQGSSQLSVAQIAVQPLSCDGEQKSAKEVQKQAGLQFTKTIIHPTENNEQFQDLPSQEQIKGLNNIELESRLHKYPHSDVPLQVFEEKFKGSIDQNVNTSLIYDAERDVESLNIETPLTLASMDRQVKEIHSETENLFYDNTSGLVLSKNDMMEEVKQSPIKKTCLSSNQEQCVPIQTQSRFRQETDPDINESFAVNTFVLEETFENGSSVESSLLQKSPQTDNNQLQVQHILDLEDKHKHFFGLQKVPNAKGSVDTQKSQNVLSDNVAEVAIEENKQNTIGLNKTAFQDHYDNISVLSPKRCEEMELNNVHSMLVSTPLLKTGNDEIIDIPVSVTQQGPSLKSTESIQKIQELHQSTFNQLTNHIYEPCKVGVEVYVCRKEKRLPLHTQHYQYNDMSVNLTQHSKPSVLENTYTYQANHVKDKCAILHGQPLPQMLCTQTKEKFDHHTIEPLDSDDFISTSSSHQIAQMGMNLLAIKTTDNECQNLYDSIAKGKADSFVLSTDNNPVNSFVCNKSILQSEKENLENQAILGVSNVESPNHVCAEIKQVQNFQVTSKGNAIGNVRQNTFSDHGQKEDCQGSKDHVVPEASMSTDMEWKDVSLYGEAQRVKKHHLETERKRAFQWNDVYASTFLQSLNRPTADLENHPVSELGLFQPQRQTQRPLRVGLSKKQRVKSLHDK